MTKTAKQLPLLLGGDTVRVKDPDGWKTKATVLQEVAPRSYNVRTEEGQIFRRNRRSLLKTQESIQDLNEAYIECESSTPPLTDCNGTNPLTPCEPVLRRSTRETREPDTLNL